MRFLLCLGLVLVTFNVRASCIFVDEMLSLWQEEESDLVYKFCAESMNDDSSQAKLAEMYDKGSKTV